MPHRATCISTQSIRSIRSTSPPPRLTAATQLCLALALLLGACASVAPEPPAEPAKTTAKQARAPAAARPAKAATPFADDEARRTIYFAFGGAAINSESEEILRDNAQKLKDDPQLVVTLVGHTDNLGSAAYNLAVADQRTEAVSDRLRALGVPKNQIRRQSAGREQASKTKCDSEACRESMRRVELVYERRAR